MCKPKITLLEKLASSWSLLQSLTAKLLERKSNLVRIDLVLRQCRKTRQKQLKESSTESKWLIAIVNWTQISFGHSHKLTNKPLILWRSTMVSNKDRRTRLPMSRHRQGTRKNNLKSLLIFMTMNAQINFPTHVSKTRSINQILFNKWLTISCHSVSLF